MTADATTERSFRTLLGNTLVANVTTSFLWFALTFWAYLETRSVLVTSIVGGSYMLFIAVLGVPFGSYVDRTRKKRVMTVATAVTAAAYLVALLLYLATLRDRPITLADPWLWVFILVVLVGAVVESMRGLALSTCVTLLVPDERRSNANGLVGVANGVGFAVTSVLSGLVVGQLGMTWAVVIAAALTVVSWAHLATIEIPEPEIAHSDDLPKPVDFAGAWRAVVVVPGLVGLLVFATLNNLLGGVFMALMDPYGLTLVSVEAWGIIWGVLSFGFIVGGAWVARAGLGAQPLRALLLANVVMWCIGIGFTIRESIWLTAIGILGYMALIPVAEAAEQTVLQRVVPFERQGRVFGLAQTVEVAAAPLSAFVVGPVAEFWLIPYAASDTGRARLDWLLGDGQARGIALVFVVTGVAGLAVTLWAFTTRSYRWLSRRYAEAGPVILADSTDAATPPATT